jgi:hypothetical protein
MITSNIAKTENLLEEIASSRRHTVLAMLLQTVRRCVSKVTSQITARQKGIERWYQY